MCNYAEIKKEKSDTDISDSNGRKRERARNDNMDNESKDPLHPTRSDGDNDRIGTESRPANMMASAPWWSRVIFRWPYPLLKLGLERPLEEIDLPEILPKDTSRYNREYLMELWDREKERCRKKNQCRTSGSSQQPPLKPSLHRAILRDFFHSMWYIQPCMFLSSTAKIVQALFLGKLIESFEVSGANTSGYIFAGVIVACGIVVLFEHHHIFFVTWRKGMQLRVSCVGAIYGKCLKLSSTHQETNANSGRIMNLASNDVERFLLASLFISYLIWSPLQAIAILVVGWFQMGPAFAVGFCLLIFGFVPFQFYLSNRFAFLRSKIAAITDQRVNFVSQAVQGARVMKMSGYEYRFFDRISKGRHREVAQIIRATNLKALNEALFFACNIVVSLVIFLMHVGVFDGTLSPGNVYTVFTLVNILQLELTKHVSLGVMGVSEVYVSISRIQKFLEFPERPAGNTSKCVANLLSGEGKMDRGPKGADDLIASSTDSEPNDQKIAISLSNVDCYWNQVKACDSRSDEKVSPTGPELDMVKPASTSSSEKEEETESAIDSGLVSALSDISLDLERGRLTCVIGTVGSGKSALLQAVVGELPAYRGSISFISEEGSYQTSNSSRQKISYAAQDPWIMDGTVRENITMGLSFRQEWYDKVVDACGLRMDFSLFRDGDSTIVGDRGVQCSGGQRARIGLARAIYRDAEVLVADDPLSAVDAKVGRQIFQEALLGLCVNQGICVLLATHQHQYVHNYRCVLMVDGRIGCRGSYAECLDAAGGKLSIHEAADIDDTSINKSQLGEDDAEEQMRTPIRDARESVVKTSNDEIGNIEVEVEKSAGNTAAKEESKEGTNRGVVEFETYKNYIYAMGGWPVAAFLLFTFCTTQGVALWTIITMGLWAELPPQEQRSWNIVGIQESA
ncbi:unnamed protein product [Pseudo-nitzschia multistriata]|uniref:ABC transporter domain-containing protein n=1 Tax=Pseudo-nitzschia multistriata TaxID=183589 RepID=A0A448ZT79_9STRA|nr:unnamed protein product [Pseudo-nitzschia multistriata]